ncbi:Gfo/Idh/MocA family oxidoreductase [Flavobacteriaceae bacterium]|nr:Gfo/Idh/MocA family oxidoreductase [Flavobacteriaceae bacterium]
MIDKNEKKISTRSIKWGIVGLGNIAHKFASDLKRVPQAELIAVASSDIERAKAFQNEFEGQKAYGSYEELFEDPEIEVVYIASLNQNHKTMEIISTDSRFPF